MVDWSRGRLTYGGASTTDNECIWYSPGCLPRVQADLFTPLFDAPDATAAWPRDLFEPGRKP